MKSIQYKTSGENSVKDVDDKSRTVINVFSKTDVVDSDNDSIASSAYEKTLKEQGPLGKGLIYHLTDHIPSIKNSLVGKFSELSMKGDELVGVTVIPKTTWGNDILELYKAKVIAQHSIGFYAVQSEKDQTTGVNIIKEIKLQEGSSVLWGANEYTPNISAGKTLKNMSFKKSEEYFKNIQKRLDKLTKVLKDGHLSDETAEFLEKEIKQIQNSLQILFDTAFTTEPESKDSVEPEATTIKSEVKDEKVSNEVFKQLLLRTQKINNL